MTSPSTLAPTAQRKIIHCDCDSFYASVETRDNVELAGHPLAVGGSPDKRGVVATCNYEARKYGIHSAMPMSHAVRLCPELNIIRPRMSVYREVSKQIREIFEDYSHLIEPLSLDEAFLDVTQCQHQQGSATRIAEEIRTRTRETLGITISAGIAPNKFLAKIASDWNKPDGQFTITPNEIEEFVRVLPIEKLFGVGAVTAKKMHAANIKTCADFRTLSLTEATRRYGKFGARLFDLSRGIDNRPVNPNRVRKSISVERTYAVDLKDQAACVKELDALFPELCERIEKNIAGKLVKNCTMKVRFSDFETTTVTCTTASVAKEIFIQLLTTAWQRQEKPVRLLGIGVGIRQIDSEDQLELFDCES